MKEENTGFGCSYYEVLVDHPNLYKEGKEPYLAEFGEISEALELSMPESVIMKEIWRTAAARQGRKKMGNTPLRATEKILFFSQRMHYVAKYNEDNK